MTPRAKCPRPHHSLLRNGASAGHNRRLGDPSNGTDLFGAKRTPRGGTRVPVPSPSVTRGRHQLAAAVRARPPLPALPPAPRDTPGDVRAGKGQGSLPVPPPV